MLISNGIATRNIAPHKLAEYEKKGYAEVQTPKEEKAPKKGKETAKA